MFDRPTLDILNGQGVRRRPANTTAPFGAYPPLKDPIWKKGHTVVEILTRYMGEMKGY